MQVTLMGPDDLGHWFLTDSDGDTFPFVECHEDHLKAALLGWDQPEGIEGEAAIMDALDWLLDRTGDDFDAPAHVAAFFHQIDADEEE